MIDLRKLMVKGSLQKVGFLKKYNATDLFFQEGDLGSEMYVVLSGVVDVIIHTAGNQPIHIASLGAGDIFGEMTFLEGLPRSATIIAKEDALVLVIDHNNFEKIIRRQPFMAYSIMKVLSQRIRQQNEEIRRLKADCTLKG